MGLFYPEWLRVALISVSNPPSATGYQVKVTVTWQPGMNDDFSDIRFSDYYRTLPYWIESSTTRTSATVWVRLTETGDAARDLFLYYGNGGAASESSGANTFDFFDDFDGAALDTSKWNTTGTGGIAVSGGVLTITAGAGGNRSIYGKTLFGTNTVMRARSKVTGGSDASIVCYTDAFPDNSSMNVCELTSYKTYHFTKKAGTFTEGYGAVNKSDNYMTSEIIRNSTSSIINTIDGVTNVTVSSSTYIPTVDLTPGFITWATSATVISVMWVAVRKYQATEPTCTVSGYGVNPSISYFAYPWPAPASGGSTTEVSLSATSPGVATLARGASHYRALTGTSPGSAALTRVVSYYRTLTSTSPGQAVLTRAASYYRTLTSTSPGTATLTYGRLYLRTLAATSAGAAVLAYKQVLGITLAATSAGAAVLARVATHCRTLAGSSAGSATIARVASFYRTLAGTSPGSSTLSRTASHYRTLTGTSPGTATLSRSLSYYRTLTATSPGTAILARAATYYRTLTSTPVGTAIVSAVKKTTGAFYQVTLSATSAVSAACGRFYIEYVPVEFKSAVAVFGRAIDKIKSIRRRDISIASIKRRNIKRRKI